MWGPTGMKSAPSRNFLNFSFEMACFGASWAVFFTQDLAGYCNYNTVFAGQAAMLKRK